jgi:hypothetical protein
MKSSKALFAIVCTLVLQLTSTDSSDSSETSSPIFLWEDNQSADLNRTFYEDQYYLPNGVPKGKIFAWTQDLKWVSFATSDRIFHLEKLVKGSWKKEELGGSTRFLWSAGGEYIAVFYIEPFCGSRIWCSGKYSYRIRNEDIVFKEFTLNFVPVKSNIKIKLTTVKEQAWGAMYTLKATVTPKVSITCSVERDDENIGTLKIKNGSGSIKYRALQESKPASGRSVVNLYTVCKSSKYYGVAEVGFNLFVP